MSEHFKVMIIEEMRKHDYIYQNALSSSLKSALWHRTQGV